MTLITLATENPGGGLSPVRITLLDLVRAVGEITRDEQELLATVDYMIRTGRVRLTGEFREDAIDALF